MQARLNNDEMAYYSVFLRDVNPQGLICPVVLSYSLCVLFYLPPVNHVHGSKSFIQYGYSGRRSAVHGSFEYRYRKIDYELSWS